MKLLQMKMTRWALTFFFFLRVQLGSQGEFRISFQMYMSVFFLLFSFYSQGTNWVSGCIQNGISGCIQNGISGCIQNGISGYLQNVLVCRVELG